MTVSVRLSVRDRIVESGLRSSALCVVARCAPTSFVQLRAVSHEAARSCRSDEVIQYSCQRVCVSTMSGQPPSVGRTAECSVRSPADVTDHR